MVETQQEEEEEEDETELREGSIAANAINQSIQKLENRAVGVKTKGLALAEMWSHLGIQNLSLVQMLEEEGPAACAWGGYKDPDFIAARIRMRIRARVWPGQQFIFFRGYDKMLFCLYVEIQNSINVYGTVPYGVPTRYNLCTSTYRW